MPSKIYKKGKLTKQSKLRLQKRLDRENKKAKAGKLAKKTFKKTTVSSSAPKTTDSPKAVTPQKTAPKTVAVPKQNKELRMEDIEDTPPPSKMVKARQQAMDQNHDVNWISLTGYNQIEAENEEKLYKHLENESNASFRRDLGEQTLIKQQQENREKQSKNDYRDELNKKFVNYQNEDAAKFKKSHSKMLELKKIRQTQVDELNQRRKYEEMKMRKHEMRAVEKLKKALLAEKMENKAKKECNMLKLKEMLIDNEKQKAIKEKIRLDEDADAIRLQKEYAQMLKEQEEKREKRLKATYEKQQQKFQALISATADITEKAKEDARKAEIELKKRQKLQDKKERLKQEKLKHEMAECKKAIDAQIKDKMSKMKVDILEDKAYGKKMVKLHNEYLAEIEEQKAEKYRKQREQSLYLELQIAALEKKKQEQKTEMSETEKLLNKGLLDEVRKFKSSPNKKEIMMKKKKDSIVIDPRAPFQFRYQIRKTPF